MSVPPLGNTFEGGTDGVAVTTGNSGGLSGDAFDDVFGTLALFSATQKRDTLSCQIAQPGSFSHTYCGWTGLGSITTSVYFRSYIWIPSAPAGSALYFISARNAAGAQSAICTVGTLGGGLITMRNAAGSTIAAATGTVPVATSQWVRVEWRVLASTTAGEVEWRLFNTADSTTADDTGSATGQVLGANTDQARFGNMAAPASYTNYFDDIAVSSTDWLGPVVAPSVALRFDYSKFPKSMMRSR